MNKFAILKRWRYHRVMRAFQFFLHRTVDITPSEESVIIDDIPLFSLTPEKGFRQESRAAEIRDLKEEIFGGSPPRPCIFFITPHNGRGIVMNNYVNNSI